MKDWLRILGYGRRYWYLLAAATVLMALVGALHGGMALLIQPIFDQVLNPQAANVGPLFTMPFFQKQVFLADLVPAFIHNIWTMVAIAIVLVFLLRGLFDYFGNYLINFVGFSAVTDLRNEVFEKVLRHGAAFFETTSTGRLMSSIMNDIEKIQVANSHILADLLRQTFSLLGLLFVVFHADWKLAAVSLTVLPFVLVPTARLGKRIRRTSRTTQDTAGELNQVLQEAISGHQVVKAFAAEQYELGKFRAASARLLKNNLRYVSQQAIASPLIELMAALTVVALLTYARGQIKAGAMTTGQFTSFMIALLMLYEPVKRLTNIHNIFEQAIGASQKVFEYLDQPVDIADARGAEMLDGFKHRISFEGVSFKYPSANGLQLNQLTLDVNAGEVVALVGPSGAGKTTLASLVPRFHDVTSGAIRIDGTDVRQLKLASLREKVSLVAQDTFLFNDTVAANIAYGLKDIPKARIIEAATAALAHEFIEKLPHGYDTLTGERGVKLSGGQRQRLSIARALLKNAPILILDEATSHLDTESEMLVQKALANLMQGRTVIVIAHRISTIRRADKIVVLDKGRMVETGTHESLIQKGGIYHRLHELQFLGAAEADAVEVDGG